MRDSEVWCQKEREHFEKMETKVICVFSADNDMWVSYRWGQKGYTDDVITDKKKSRVWVPLSETTFSLNARAVYAPGCWACSFIYQWFRWNNNEILKLKKGISHYNNIDDILFVPATSDCSFKISRLVSDMINKMAGHINNISLSV